MPNNKKLSKIAPSFADKLSFLKLGFRDIRLFVAAQKYDSFIAHFRKLTPKYLEWASHMRARRLFYFAVKNVPAYQTFLSDKQIESWADVPFTDKENYIKKFTAATRCAGGKIPATGIAVDESSGSTGTPYNWVRTTRERKESHAFISYFSTFSFGKQPPFTINAFSMGAWATGINMGIALQRNGIVKCTGPDIDKILNTLEFFGTDYDYMIAGYPPFLKQLYDHAKAHNFPWEKYKFSALVGGEGMSEGLRDYLLPGFEKVYSGYGATDLEIGIAGETPLTIALRRLAREKPEVRAAIFGEDSRLPMVFQYNPLMHYIEVNDNRELIFTITRKSVLSPRIRYNIHDEGGICRYDQMAEKLKALGYDIDELGKGGAEKNIALPLMWVYGRRDFTISIMGANIYPEDIEQCLYADRELAGITRSFCQAVAEGENAAVRPAFYFEITVPPTEDLKQRFADSILEKLIKLNADFRAAWHEYADTLKPEIHLFAEGDGPFKVVPGKIKQTRILK